jgi:outer membrane receptor protein involved in Fe transport
MNFRYLTKCIISAVTLVMLLPALLFAQGNTGKIKGMVMDASSGEPLPGANVLIKGTSLGAATNLEGEYVIYNVPPGRYTLRITYIGYQEKEFDIFVSYSQILEQNAELSYVVIKGEEVTITAQAEGQLQAINQQLASDAIVNVVDGTRIQELPDQNAAESIARLPGISVVRESGEGQGVAIRGLAPKYNQIQIEGVALSSLASPIESRYSAGGRGGYNGRISQTRAVDLSMISQENLGAIEVYKSITPDMDANTLGGAVNIRLQKATPTPEYKVFLMGAYNAERDDFKQYNTYASMSRRILNNKLGIQLSINSERRNRGGDRLSAGFQREDVRDETGALTGETKFRMTSGLVSDNRLDVIKHGLNAIFDYDLPRSKFLFSNFMSYGSRHSLVLDRGNSYTHGGDSKREEYMISNSLRGTHNILGTETEWTVSHYHAETKHPYDIWLQWDMYNYDSDIVKNLSTYLTPEEYMAGLPTKADLLYRDSDMGRSNLTEVKFSEKLDIKYPFYLSDHLSGFLKFGGELKQIERKSRAEWGGMFTGYFGGSDPSIKDFPTNYNPDPVLNDKIRIGHFKFDVDKLSACWNEWLSQFHDLIGMDNPLKGPNDDYNLTENYSAGYFMFKLNAFRNLLTVIPGVRYDREDMSATGYYHYITSSEGRYVGGINEPRPVKRTYDYWLPMVQLKVKPVEWFDVRLAATKTLSRPDYQYRIPYETGTVNEYALQKGNPDLGSATSRNFDLYTSIYHQKFGLITLGGFYKEIENFSYLITHYLKDSTTVMKYGLPPTNEYMLHEFSHPENTHGISTLKGFEIEYQANLSSLPGLLKHIVFSMNFTRIFSESWLRKYKTTSEFVPYPPYSLTTYDTGYRRGPLPTQPDKILNVSLGYEIGGFSGRISIFHQGESLQEVGRLPETDTYVKPYTRYDLSFRYRFNDHLSFLLTGVNFTNTPDITHLHDTSKHSTYQIYGSMYDFGFQYNF